MIRRFHKKNAKGFTLIELMIVIAIIGILAAIAIPQFQAYRIRGYNTAARSDAKNAYTAAQALYSDSPAANIAAPADLTDFGFKQTANVTVTGGGAMNALSMTTTHANGNITYTVDSAGQILP